MPRPAPRSRAHSAHRAVVYPLALLALALVPLTPLVAAEGDPAADMAAARAVFTANLDAIAAHDREAYLDTYLHSERLVRTGPGGFTLGFEAHAEAAGETWPVVFDARNLELAPVEPGVVYGTYRYRVVYEDEGGAGGRREITGLSERLFVDTPDGFKIAMTSAFEAPPGTPPPPHALVGGTLIDGTGGSPVPDSVVLLRGGKIDCAGSRRACPVPAQGVEVTDVSGHFITPGLVDAHVHFSQTGWADGRPDSLDVRDLYPYAATEAGLEAEPERFFRAFLCSGVTSVFDVGGYPWTFDLPAAAEGDTLAPRVRVAGPLLSTLDHWLNLPAERQFIYIDDPETAREGVRYLAEEGTDAVKVWFIENPEREFGEMEAAVAAAGEEAERLDLPLIVHATSLRTAKAALEAGASLLVHSIGDQPVDEEFLELARRSGAVYTPTLTVLGGYQRMYEAALEGRPPMIDDPHGCVDPATRRKVARSAEFGDRVDAERVAARAERGAERSAIEADNLRRVAEAGIPIAMGTDAGNPLTLHGPSVYTELEAMQAAGLEPQEVLVAATRNGARAMGRAAELGTVEAGKLADLLVLGADPTADVSAFRKLVFVVRGGELRPVEELAAYYAEPGGE